MKTRRFEFFVEFSFVQAFFTFQVKLSVVRKYNLFPSRTTEEDFSKVLYYKPG